MRRALFAVTSLALVLAACHVGPSVTTPSSTAPSCMRDEDCQTGACGPCEANAAITPDAVAAECVVHPCPGTRAYCTPAHTCAVR